MTEQQWADTVLPYPEPDGTRTTGWSGSETSRDRAVAEADNGTAAQRQRDVMDWLALTPSNGATVREIREWTGLHHGQASSALSVLHKEGKIARLTEKRHRCAVYVLPEYVNGRDTASHGRQKPSRLTEAERDSLFEARERVDAGFVVPTHHVRRLVEALERLT